MPKFALSVKPVTAGRRLVAEKTIVKPYRALMLSFEREAESIWRERVRYIQIRGDWAEYGKAFKMRCNCLATSVVLRAALWIHALRLPGPYRGVARLVGR